MEASRKPTAWEIEAELAAAITELEALPEGDPMTEWLADRVLECLEARDGKRDALAAAVFMKRREIAALEARADDAAAKAATVARGLERLEAYILSLLDAMGEKQVRGEQYKIGWQQNPDRVEVEPDFYARGGVSTRFVREVPAKVEPDKRAIAEALKAGEDVPGARLVPGSRRVVIK